jgi:hypothetical protein
MRSMYNNSNRSETNINNNKKVVSNYEDILVKKYLEELHSKNE